jgi:iron complex transport system substrate-binding protein
MKFIPDSKVAAPRHCGEPRMRSRRPGIVCAAACMAGLLCGLPEGDRLAAAARNDDNRIVVDMADRTVSVPRHVHRVACFEVLCYEKFFLLGGSGRVAAMYRTDPPWMARIDPNVAHVPKVENDPNREELLKDGIDVVFLRFDRPQLRGLAAAGIPAIVSQPPLLTHFKDAVAFGDAQKRMVRLFASIIGEDAERKAEEWCAYYDERIGYITARTANIPEAQRPKAYYLRGPNAINTQGPHSNTYWYGVIAGADMIVKNLPINGQGPMSMEEIVSLDPDFIFVGRQYKPELVLNDTRWRDISAVRDHHVVPLPEGMFYWDGSTEGILLAEFIAKTLYPDHFGDLDMAREVRRYFKTFYGFDFTDDEMGKFLRGLTPDGIRRNH